jgi:hypothetical protein
MSWLTAIGILGVFVGFVALGCWILDELWASKDWE